MKKREKSILAGLCIIVMLTTGCTGSDDDAQDKSKSLPLEVKEIIITDALVGLFSPEIPEEGYVFLVLKVRAINEESDALGPISIIEFSVIIESQTYDSEWLDSINDDPRFEGSDFGDDSGQIEPGGHIEGWIIFEVPEGVDEVDEIELRFTDFAIIGGGDYSSTTFSGKDAEFLQNEPPVANAGGDQTVFVEGEATFDGSSSTDPEGCDLEYQWDWGDDSYGGYDEIETHEYDELGEYEVTLTVTDCLGGVAVDTISVEVISKFELKVNAHGWHVPTGLFDYHDGDYEVNITLKNEFTEEEDIYSTFFKLKTSEGTSYDWSGDDGNVPSELDSGASASWTVYFDIPEGSSPVSITYDEHTEVKF